MAMSRARVRPAEAVSGLGHGLSPGNGHRARVGHCGSQTQADTGSDTGTEIPAAGGPLTRVGRVDHIRGDPSYWCKSSSRSSLDIVFTEASRTGLGVTSTVSHLSAGLATPLLDMAKQIFKGCNVVRGACGTANPHRSAPSRRPCPTSCWQTTRATRR